MGASCNDGCFGYARDRRSGRLLASEQSGKPLTCIHNIWTIYRNETFGSTDRLWRREPRRDRGVAGAMSGRRGPFGRSDTPRALGRTAIGRAGTGTGCPVPIRGRGEGTGRHHGRKTPEPVEPHLPPNPAECARPGAHPALEGRRNPAQDPRRPMNERP